MSHNPIRPVATDLVTWLAAADGTDSSRARALKSRYYALP